MRKIILCALVFIFVSFYILAETTKEHDFRFSIGTSIGILAGKSEEIVYRDGNSSEKLSQLLWQFKPLVYAGLDFHYIWFGQETGAYFFTGLYFKYGLPGGSGLMEDRDWLIDQSPDLLTHYSVHDNTTNSAFLIDADVGGSFGFLRELRLKLYFSYSYMTFSWTASGGSFLYPDYNGGHVPGSGDCGTYTQIWQILSPGFSFYGTFYRIFDFELSFRASPLVWCYDKDEHLLKGLVINDYLFGGVFMEPGLLFSFKPVSFLSLSTSVSYRYISGTRGDAVYHRKGRPASTYENSSGAGYSAFNISITAKFLLFKDRRPAGLR